MTHCPTLEMGVSFWDRADGCVAEVMGKSFWPDDALGFGLRHRLHDAESLRAAGYECSGT